MFPGKFPPRFKGGRGLRKKPGERNQWEADYEAQVLEPGKRDGTIIEYWFQSVTFKLADDCRFVPDYLLLMADGFVEIHDVKGSQKIKKAGHDPKERLGSKAFVEDDAKVKLRVFADKFPFRCFAVFKRRNYEGGGWGREEYTSWSNAGSSESNSLHAVSTDVANNQVELL